MNRAHQMSYCKQCKLREFSKNEGVICSLTGLKATFEEDCPDYKVDQKMLERNRELEEERLEDQQSSNTIGLSMFGIKNQILAGALAIIGSVVWFIAGASADIIFFYPPILFILGLVTLIQGVVTSNKRAKLKKKQQKNADLLDK
jgi:hypothetical protein